MIVGITGTRSGMTEYQRNEVMEFLDRYPVIEFHHGDCVGVDVEVAEIAQIKNITTISHPPVIDELRAFHKSDFIREKYSYFKRNRNIVDESDILLVVPYQDEHQGTGGTWYTHDYARKIKTPICLIYPTKKLF